MIFQKHDFDGPVRDSQRGHPSPSTTTNARRIKIGRLITTNDFFYRIEELLATDFSLKGKHKVSSVHPRTSFRVTKQQD